MIEMLQRSEKNKLEIRKNKIMFHAQDGSIHMPVMVKDETIWLSLNEIAELFQRDKSVIAKHIKKIWKEGELEQKGVMAKNATTGPDGKTYQVEYFNLDMIISVGYRVNSKRGTEFRRWASQILKQYLIKGYAINEKRLKAEEQALKHLKQQGIKEITVALDLLKRSLKDPDSNHNHISDMGEKALEIIAQYAKSWHLLLAYDENRLISPILQSIDCKITVEDLEPGIQRLKSKLMEQKEATDLFGQPMTDGIKGIFGNVHQTFAQKMLYSSVLERASHLFYFVIKDHPFIDGNKRIACFLLLVYLDQHQIKLDSLTNGALVALALLIAKSEPTEKDITLKLIENVIAGEY